MFHSNRDRVSFRIELHGNRDTSVSLPFLNFRRDRIIHPFHQACTWDWTVCDAETCVSRLQSFEGNLFTSLGLFKVRLLERNIVAVQFTRNHVGNESTQHILTTLFLGKSVCCAVNCHGHSDVHAELSIGAYNLYTRRIRSVGSIRHTGGDRVTAVHQNFVLIVLNSILNNARIPVYVWSIDGDNRTFRSTIRREGRNKEG